MIVDLVPFLFFLFVWDVNSLFGMLIPGLFRLLLLLVGPLEQRISDALWRRKHANLDAGKLAAIVEVEADYSAVADPGGVDSGTRVQGCDQIRRQ